MRSLTLHQPWASLIAVGAKTIETRSWSTTYRGPILIHASKTVARMGEGWDGWARLPAGTYEATRSTESPTRFPPDGQLVEGLPVGAVVAVCDLEAVVPTEDVRFDGTLGSDTILLVSPGRCTLHSQSDNEPLGDYSPGRYAWMLDRIRPLTTPVPARGRQGLWTPDADLLAAVEAV